jgi:hypothetical protein
VQAKEWYRGDQKTIPDEGYTCKVVEYDDSMDSDMIKNWQAVCHDEYRKIESMTHSREFKNICEGGSWAQCTADVIGAFGKGRRTTVYPWASLAKKLTLPGNSGPSVWSGVQDVGAFWALLGLDRLFIGFSWGLAWAWILLFRFQSGLNLVLVGLQMRFYWVLVGPHSH